MHVLLDEQLPRHLAREIGGHDVSTVQQRGWAGLQNGELLRVAAAAGFEVLVTADRNLAVSTKPLTITYRNHPAHCTQQCA